MLQAGQMARACAVGIFFWFVAAMTVRSGGWLFGGWGSVEMLRRPFRCYGRRFG